MKIKQRIYRLYFFLFAMLTIFLSSSPVYGQVTIGSSEPSEKAFLLEIKSQKADNNNITSDKGGMLLPKIQLIDINTLQPFINLSDKEWNSSNQKETKSKHAGLMVYNLSTINGFSKGVYTWNGEKWILGKISIPVYYFYPPAFDLPLPKITGSGEKPFTFNVYEVYEKQFNKTNISTGTDYNEDQWIATNSTLERVPSPTLGRLYTAEELDYVITYYDNNILTDVSINNKGIMSYKVKDNNPDRTSFVNLIFVVKP